MAPSYRNNPVFLCRQIELAIDKLVVRPGSLHQRLVEMRETLLISPADFPTGQLALAWDGLRRALAALPACGGEISDDDAVVVIACSLLDFRNELRQWLVRNEPLDDAHTAA